MSHTANAKSEQVGEPNRPYLELSRMMRQGRSWSGRERNCAFLNTRDGRFATVSATTAFDFLDDARAVAVTDWDQDGDLDLWVSNRNAPRLRFLRNQSPASDRWIALLLEGDGERTNRDAIGARVEVHLPGGVVLRRTARAGAGFLTQSSRWLHFGLGTADSVDRVVVHWPGGGGETHDSPRTGRRYRVIQGDSALREWSRGAAASAIEPSVQEARPTTSRARIPLITLFRMPAAPYRDFDGADRRQDFGHGRSVLIVLWASWCRPCIVELSELSSRAADLARADVDVIALATDGLGDDRGDPANARRHIARLDFAHRSGLATDGLLRMMQHLHDSHVALHRPLPLPTSFLVDGRGRLAVIYKGPVEVDRLIADAASSGADRHERERRAAAAPGRALTHPRADEVASLIDTQARFQLALGVATAGRVEDAKAQYRDVLAAKPDFVEAHNNLGLLQLRSGELAEAEASFRRAIETRPRTPAAWHNLGKVLERTAGAPAAEAAYRRALEIDSRFPSAWNDLGLLLAKQGDLRRAATCFAREIEHHPDRAEAYNNLGIVLLKNRLHDQAIERFRKAIELDDRYVEALTNLGVAYLEQGRRDDAQRELKRALAIDPSFTPARRNLERAASRN